MVAAPMIDASRSYERSLSFLSAILIIPISVDEPLQSPVHSGAPAQKEAMKLLILRLHREFPDIKTILGHRDLPGMQKACPCFDATKLQSLLAS